MTDHTFSISDDLYNRAQQVADQTDQPVQQVIQHRLEAAFAEPDLDLPVDEQTELHALQYLSADAVWAIMQSQMPQAKSARMSVLMEQNTHGNLTEAERAELTELVEDGDRLMLRKAKAMEVLLGRGITVSMEDMQPKNE